MMDDLVFQSASTLCKMLRRREVSPVELVEAHIRRIEKLNPALNAIVTLAPDLIDQAKKAETAIKLGRGGELSGLPLTVKDTIETAGMRSTSGSSRRANFVPERDAPAVARLKSAGAIILGKTNTAEMAMDYTADNPVFGRTNNPYDSSRTPGGSSGGEAAAIAACMTPAGIGSDLAGSIRIPAHFCGIAGLKPGAARVPGEGQFPASNGPYGLGSAIGPMGRSIEDLRLLFAALTDTSLETREVPEAARGKRVSWYCHDDVSPVTRETRIAVRNAAETLSAAGFDVQEYRPPGIDRGHDLWLKLFSHASVVQLRDAYNGHEDEGGSFVKWRLATAKDSPVLSLDDYIHAWIERDRLRSELIDWMEKSPLIIAPVGATPALKHDTLKVMIEGEKIGVFRAFSYAQTFNVFDLPSVTLPAGRSSEGLPIGVQIVGRPFAEGEVLAAAAIVEKTLGGWGPAPGFE